MKTPISLLQEYLIISKEYSQYKFSEIKDKNTNQKLYSCELRLVDRPYIAHGSGYGKKHAKQEAAKSMLIILSKDRYQVRILLEEHKKDLEMFMKSMPLTLQAVYQQESSDNNSNQKLINEIPNSDMDSSMRKQEEDNKEEEITLEEFEELLKEFNLVPCYTFNEDSFSSLSSCKLELFAGLLYVKSQGKTQYEAKTKAAGNMYKQLVEQKTIMEKILKEDKDFPNETVIDSQISKDIIKTPVSLLQEYLAGKEYLLPRYQFSPALSHSASSGRWFRCKVELMLDKKFCAEATGLTKRQAKQKTALNILVQLSLERSEVKELLKKNKFLQQDQIKSEKNSTKSVVSKENPILEEDPSNSNSTKGFSTINNIEDSSISNSAEDLSSEKNAKTPLSLLQEYLTKHNIRPVYVEKKLPKNLTSGKDQFHCKLELYDGTFYSEAIALSKKLAKHETAKSMLLKLSEHKEDVKQLLNRNNFDQFMNKDSCQEKSRNSISLLEEYCRYENMQSPNYTFKGETGQAHKKLFTMQCEVEDIIVEGTGSKISSAKHNSAANMMLRLKEEVKKMDASEKSSYHSKIKYTELTCSDINNYQLFGDSNPNEIPEYSRKENTVSADSRASNVSEDDNREDKVNTENNPSKVKCLQVNSKNFKYKILMDIDKFKSLEDVRSFITKQHTLLGVRELNIADIMNRIRLNKGLEFNGSNNAWFEYLDQSPLEVLCSTVDVLKCDKDMNIDVKTRDQMVSNESSNRVYYTTCKLRVKEHSWNFMSSESEKEESQRKVYIELLKYLTSLVNNDTTKN